MGRRSAIQQYAALFSLLGTAYGGNGTSFQLPNLQSRLPVAQGQGSGLSNYFLGQAAGTPTVNLTLQNMPNHTHMLNATTAMADAGIAPMRCPPSRTVRSQILISIGPGIGPARADASGDGRRRLRSGGRQ